MSVERPTFHESWYRVAGLRPQLRATVQTYRQEFRGQVWHVVADPSNNLHFRLDDAGYHFVGLLDGRRTVEQVWRVCNDHLGDRAPTQGEVINLLGQLYTSNLLRSDLPADAAGMFENYRRHRRRRIGGFFLNLLFVRIPLLDPDRILERWCPLVGPFFGRRGLALWALLLLIGATQLIGRWDDLLQGTAGVLAPGNLFLLYISFAIIKLVHEFGHGFACKRAGQLGGSGGEVHVMGLMLLVFTPVPYVDASSAWALRSKWHRAFVGAAGMYVELAVAALAAIVWANTSPGVVNALAYNMIFVASVSTLLFNANPLLRFDGYYILSDVLEIPNLAKRSRDALFHLVKRHVYGASRLVSPIRTGGERFWLPVYGAASAVYRVVIFTGIILFVADKLFFVGALMAVAGLISWVFVPLGRFGRYLAASSELHKVRGRAALTTGAFFAVLAGGLGIIPFPDRARAEGVVEPHDLAVIYMGVDGFVGDVLASGAWASPQGPPLLVARNPQLEMRREELIAEHRLTEIEHERASLDEVALAQSLAQRLRALQEQIARVEEQLADLQVRPPIEGRWIAPQVDRLPGSYVRRGDAIGMVASVDRLLIRAVADQSLGPRIEREGARGHVEVRMRGRPEASFTGTVTQVLPAGLEQLPSAALGYLAGGTTQVAADDRSGTRTVEPFFEVHIDPGGSAWAPDSLLSGQRVVARFELPSRPLLAQWWRDLRQLVQRRFQI